MEDSTPSNIFNLLKIRQNKLLEIKKVIYSRDWISAIELLKVLESFNLYDPYIEAKYADTLVWNPQDDKSNLEKKIKLTFDLFMLNCSRKREEDLKEKLFAINSM